MMRSRLLFLLLVIVVLVTGGAQSVAAQTAPDFDLPGGGHFYTQANGGAGAQYGYRITDDGGIKFWSEFQRLGGVAALGYPASTRFTLDGFTVQATQKVILQWRPEVSQVYFVNVFDKLHDQGLDNALLSRFQIPLPVDPNFDSGKTPDQAQQQRLALLNGDSAIAARYNAAGANAILYNGLPTSTVQDLGPFVVLRAQRVAFQHWKQDNSAAGIKAGDVSVVNGGDAAKSLGLVAAPSAVPETSSGQPAPAPAAAAPTPTPTASPSWAYRSKEVTDPPVKCNNDPNISSVPCLASAPNTGLQYIKGRIMDPTGTPLLNVPVQACQDNGGCQYTYTSGDGTFTFFINKFAGCPVDVRTYRVMVTDQLGMQ
ncbi:MAG: hypothetical protein JOZ39_13345, partial [Chloroflexi bacterium]|nr:hypothetical protein [Chloroflexota bacterium]